MITNLTSYAKINEYGFIQTPYRRVLADGSVLEEAVYLSADEEADYVIAQANEVVDGRLVNEQVVARFRGETILAKRERVELADVSPKQIISVATACIPFLENDDASRALMGANMQRQAVPLIQPLHHMLVQVSNTVLQRTPVVVWYVKAMVLLNMLNVRHVIVAEDDGNRREYKIRKFARSNAGTSINQIPLVRKGERVEKGDILVDGPSMEKGELALGQNVTIAYMSWNGYNYKMRSSCLNV